MAFTRSCGAMCSFCYAMIQEPQERKAIKTAYALNLLDDFEEIEVRGVSLISDGESTLSPAYIPFIKHAANVGIDVSNATGAWDWNPEKKLIKYCPILPGLDLLLLQVLLNDMQR